MEVRGARGPEGLALSVVAFSALFGSLPENENSAGFLVFLCLSRGLAERDNWGAGST